MNFVEVLDACLMKGSYAPLKILGDIEFIKIYLEYHFYKYDPDIIKNTLKFLNINIEKITKTYEFLDKIFNNIKMENLDNYIKYIYDNKIYFKYRKQNLEFLYDKYLIFGYLYINFNIKEKYIDELLENYAEKYFNLDVEYCNISNLN